MELDLEAITFDFVSSVDSKTRDQKSEELDRTTDNAYPQYLQELIQNQLKPIVKTVEKQNEEISELNCKMKQLSTTITDYMTTENSLLKEILALKKRIHQLEESIADSKPENQIKISTSDSGKQDLMQEK